ncbi:hypothetical protein [Mucilaginibacter puniceus]
MIQKNEKIKSAERLLCRTGLSLQIRQNRGPQKLPQGARSHASANVVCPQPHRPTSVFPDFARSLSADGDCLIRAFTSNKNEIKSGQRPAGKPGQCVLPCGWKDFSGLIFCYFFIKEKVIGLRGYERTML